MTEITDILIKVVTPCVAMVTAIYAVFTYRKNSQTKAAEFLLALHKTFFVDETFVKMKELVDCNTSEESRLRTAVEAESTKFTDFLNFFELVAYLRYAKTISADDAEGLLGYYLDLLGDKEILRDYILNFDHGFENLRKLLKERPRGLALR